MAPVTVATSLIAKQEPPGSMVIVEGMSGTGKTTYCRSMCQSTKSILVPELPEFVRYSWTRIGAPDTWLANLEIMLTVGIERQSFAARTVAHGFDVVLDRSVLSPLAIVAGLVSSKLPIASKALELCESMAPQIASDRCSLRVLNPSAEIWKVQLDRHQKARIWPWTDQQFQHAGQNLFLSLFVPHAQLGTSSVTDRTEIVTSGMLSQFYARGLRHLRRII